MTQEDNGSQSPTRSADEKVANSRRNVNVNATTTNQFRRSVDAWFDRIDRIHEVISQETHSKKHACSVFGKEASPSYIRKTLPFPFPPAVPSSEQPWQALRDHFPVPLLWW